MISIDTDDLVKLELDLRRLKSRAIPFATRSAINGLAFQGQKIARNEIRTGMVNRNKFTQQSVQVEQARTLNVSRQAALLGSIADYMETQEFGGVKNKKGKHGVPIPTAYSAGQTGKRTRLPRKANRLANITLRSRKARGKTKAQLNVIAVKEAAKSSNKFIYMDTGKSKGLFKVTGGARSPSVEMVYNLSNPSVNIPKNPWLKPSIDKLPPHWPRIYSKALSFQIKRQRLFESR